VPDDGVTMLKHHVLLSEAEIAGRVNELAEAIRAELPSPALLVVGLLTGSFVFVADLVRAMSRLGLEPRVDFLGVSHYGPGTESDGVVQIQKDVAADIRRRAVLLVDDILDSGLTLRLVRSHLAAREPMWLRTCVLLDKPSRRVVDMHADYVGFEVPDCWVIGYGLDCGGEGRALPYVGAVEPDGPEAIERKQKR
jgi:hypoxanthine phosphoribosyltransferase